MSASVPPLYPDLIVIRHGQTRWNLEGRWQGHRDSPLTPKGEAQARAMAGVLARAGITERTHRAFVSPSGRARATAGLLLGPNWTATPDDRLREIDVGRWEGWLVTDIIAELGLPEDTPPLTLYENIQGGETMTALRDRVRDFLATLDGPSLLVTHGITSRMIRTLATGRDLDRFEELPGGQGVVFRVKDGVHEALDA